MVWRFYPERQPTEIIRRTIHTGNWWTNTVKHIEIQLTANMVQLLKKHLIKAIELKKPFTLVLAVQTNSKWRKTISPGRGDELYIVAYADDNVYSVYDPEKITSIQTNSANLYFEWNDLPQPLKDFILNKKEDSEKQTTLG